MKAASRCQQVEKAWVTGKALGSAAEGREKAGSQEPQEGGTYAVWLSVDPSSPSDPSPVPALSRLINKLAAPSSSPLLPPHITLLDESSTDETPSALLAKLRAAVDRWKNGELGRREARMEPISYNFGPSLLVDDSGAMVQVLEENADYDPDYVVEGLPLRIASNDAVVWG